MHKLFTTLAAFIIGICAVNMYAQSAGDYRSAASGNWSAAATWEKYDGTAWGPAASAPVGTETITIDDSVAADAAVTISDTVRVEGSGYLTAGAGGSVRFAANSLYNHARNGGALPTATWDSASTCLLSGITGNSPSNNNQNFYNFTWNNPGQTANLNLNWSGITIGGNVTCIASGSSQFRFTNNSSFLAPITINGNLVISGGAVTTSGSSTAMTYTVNILGNVLVTGGNLGLSRASAGIGNWYLSGDFTVSNATLQTSNSASKFVFTALDTQLVSLSNVTYTGTFNYDVDSSANIRIVDNPDTVDFMVKGTLTNYSVILKDSLAVISFENGSQYIHARDGGNIPTATWRTGSACQVTGIRSNNPGNANQNFYNFTWNSVNQSGNRSTNWNGNTISGNIYVVNTGASGRLQFCAPAADSSVTTTILGDIIMTGGSLTSQGTSNANSHVVVKTYGDIFASGGGNFSIARGSQNTTGTTDWYLYGDTLSMSNVSTQNSNPDGALFYFKGPQRQHLIIDNVTFTAFPMEISAGARVNIGNGILRGSGTFRMLSGTLETANAGGFDSTVQNTGTKVILTPSFVFNGTAAQVTGANLPATVKNLTINNAAGVTLSADLQVDSLLTVTAGDLDLNGKTLTLGASGNIVQTAGNTLKGTGKATASGTLNAPAAVNVGGLGFAVTSAANLGAVSVERTHTPATGQGNSGIPVVFKVTAANNSNLNATVRFYYDDSEITGIAEGDLRLFTSPTGANNTWYMVAATVNAAQNYVEATGVPVMQYFTLADVNKPVPVELTSFTANASEKVVTLSWSTATEKQNQGWDIERKSDKSDWAKIGFVKGLGDNTKPASYKFEDKSSISGKFSYRLKQMDFDGSYKYSQPVEVEVNNIPKAYALLQNYPNPFNPSTSIKFELPQSAFVNISVYNALGEKVITLVNEQMEAGSYVKNFNASSLTSGIYFYRLTANNNIFTKKMLLVK